MRCKKCGAILLDTDTYCGKCGTKVIIDACPNCGEILRPGMRFCSSCGTEVLHLDETEPEDDDIPVTESVKTTDIPFDIIEENIIKDVERQLDKAARDDSVKPKSDRTVEKVVYEKKPPIQILEDYEEDEYQEEYTDDYVEEYEDEYVDDSEDDYVDEYDADDYDEREDGQTSVVSRLITAGMVVIGLILVLIVAIIFFRNRKTEPIEEEASQVVQEDTTSEVQEENASDNIAGTVVVIKNVNIRDLPTTDNSNVLGVAKEGETYEYYGYAENSNNWVHIKVDDSSDGYVYKDYIEIQ